LRIAQVCGSYFPDSFGGAEGYVAALAARLSAAGHHTFIAAPDPGAARDRTYQFRGLPVYRYPVPVAPTRQEYHHEAPARGAERLHAWFRETRPDVVHFHTLSVGAGPHEVRAAKAAAARVLVTAHSGSLGFVCARGTMMRWGRELCDGVVSPSKCAACELQHRGMPRPMAGVLGLIPPALGRAAVRIPGRPGATLGMSSRIVRNAALQADVIAHTDKFVVLSEHARRAVAANDGDGAPIVLSRLGIRAKASIVAEWRTKPKPRRDHVVVAYLGRFDRIKGVHDLARAIKSLGIDKPIRFEFCGPVSNIVELQVVNELKAIVGPDAWVRFLPPLEPEQALEYLHAADALCCPSVALEGGPTVALEAMAVGTPVIATRATVMSEIVEDGVNGRLLRPGDWRGLASALAEIASNPQGTIERWRNALPAIRTMDDVTTDYLRMYGA